MAPRADAPPAFDTPEPDVGTVDEGQDPTEDEQNADLPASEHVPDAQDQPDRANALRAAYGEATTTLREKHRTEFDALYVAAARKRGVDYKPKPTAEQKAEAELEDLFTKFPHLRDKVLKDEGVEKA